MSATVYTEFTCDRCWNKGQQFYREPEEGANPVYALPAGWMVATVYAGDSKPVHFCKQCVEEITKKFDRAAQERALAAESLP